MLSKLFRYEFRSTGRMILPLYAGLILLTLFTRLFTWLGDFSNIIAIPAALFVILYVMAIIGMFAVTYIFLLRRFYTNLIGDEGYLSFTLPVKPWQHIVSKLVTAVVWIIATLIVALLSLLLMFASSDLFRNIYEMTVYLVNNSQVSYVMLVIEFIIVAIVSTAASMLMLYASMAIGQLMTGHKVIGAVVSFLVFYFITQILLGIGMYIVSQVNPQMWEIINAANAVRGIAVMMLIIFAIQLVFGTVYFIITDYAFKNKLNLE